MLLTLLLAVLPPLTELQTTVVVANISLILALASLLLLAEPRSTFKGFYLVDWILISSQVFFLSYTNKTNTPCNLLQLHESPTTSVLPLS